MAEQFTLTISTPEKEFYSGDVESLIITTTEGKMGILPGHELMVVALDIAPIRFKVGESPNDSQEEWREAALSGGFAEIKGSQVLIVADSAEWPEEIEVNRAMEAKKRAEDRLRAHLSEVEYLRSKIALRRALTRLEVVNSK